MDEKNIIKTEDIPREFQHGLGPSMFSQMKKYAENTALICTETNKNENYRTTLQKSIRVALTLRHKNLEKDSIIGVCAGPHLESVIPFYSSIFLGYKVVAFDGTVSSQETSYLLKDVIRPTIMFIDEDIVPMMEKAMELSASKFELVVFGKSSKYQTYEIDYLVPRKDEEDKFKPREVDGKETALILFSSGSTGLPKGVCLSHLAILLQTENLIYLQNLTSESVVSNVISLVWLTSVLISLALVLTGGTKIQAPLNKLWKAIDHFKITHIFMSPFSTFLLIKEEIPKGCLLDSVISFWVGGDKLSPTVKSKLKMILPNTLITDSYGQTEASGWITLFKIGDKNEEKLARIKEGSVGKAVPGIQLKVVDTETGKLLGANKVGELCMKNDEMVTNGYYKRDSSSIFDEEGWMKTGDLVYYDEDECIFIVGRCKEMLIYQNFVIPPQLLEEILNSHPAVSRSVVIGIKHEIDGDHPLGLVILHEGKHATPEEIKKFVDDRVQERQKLRAGVKILKEFPLTASGKPKRAALKKMVEEGLI